MTLPTHLANMPSAKAQLGDTEVLAVAMRRRKVATLLSRRLSIEQIAEAISVSVGTVNNDIRAIRARMARELSEWSVLDIANDMRQRSIMRDLELFSALEKAKMPTGPVRDAGGKVTSYERPHGDFMAQKMFLAEMRLNAKDELQLMQSLGVVYKAPERMAVDMKVMTQLEILPQDTLAALADASDPDDFKRLLAAAVGVEQATALLGVPMAQLSAGPIEDAVLIDDEEEAEVVGEEPPVESVVSSPVEGLMASALPGDVDTV